MGPALSFIQYSIRGTWTTRGCNEDGSIEGWAIEEWERLVIFDLHPISACYTTTNVTITEEQQRRCGAVHDCLAHCYHVWTEKEELIDGNSDRMGNEDLGIGLVWRMKQAETARGHAPP